MPAFVEVQCPACQHGSRLEYRRLGSEMACSGCGAVTTPRVPVGGSYPLTQWELNYRDFLNLMGDEVSRGHVAPLLQAWFGFSLASSPVRIVDASGAAQDFLTVHLRIQDDAARQYALYQTAMSLWR